MRIKKTPSRSSAPVRASRSAAPQRSTITAGARSNRVTVSSEPRRVSVSARPVTAAQKAMNSMNPSMRQFTKQLQKNMQKVAAATNTSNIAAKPEFIELLPLFTQNLLVPEVFGTIAMTSRQQLIPYFKVKTENTKGETAAKTILSTPFVNRNGMDPNFTGRVVRNETVTANTLAYTPALPMSVSILIDGTTSYTDDGNGGFIDSAGAPVTGASIDYATGIITLGTAPTTLSATYQYDNETIGPDEQGQYGAKMGKIDLELDEINLIAQAHELACYYSVYAAFAAQQEYGANIGDLAKESAFSEITAEINTQAFAKLFEVAAAKPQFDWDASPYQSGAVVPSDYLNTFKMKLNQASAGIYQATRLAQPNKIVCGSNVAAVIGMIQGFQAESNLTGIVGPYKAGKLDQFDIYVDPNYDINTWVMACKVDGDIRRSSALFGEYMPLMATDPISLANLSVQQGYCTLYDLKVVNPGTVVSGKILGAF